MTARQPSLLDAQLAPAHNGTPTSVAAAVAATPKVSPQKRAILDLFEERWGNELWAERLNHFGDWTQDEASIELGLPRSTICARFNELERDGLIKKTEETRRTRYGRSAAVYVLAGAQDGLASATS